jgi:hypothetical protein
MPKTTHKTVKLTNNLIKMFYSIMKELEMKMISHLLYLPRPTRLKVDMRAGRVTQVVEYLPSKPQNCLKKKKKS